MMSPNPITRRRAACCAVTAAALVAPALAAAPVRADDCSVPDGLLCNPKSTKTITTGGGGGTGGGTTTSGPVAPPTVEGLTDNQAVDAVNGPAANLPPAAAPPNTVQLVEEALATKGFPKPGVNTKPHDKTYVRFKTSLWVENFILVETEPKTVGNQTVQAKAVPSSVTWDMGERKFTCDDAGEDGKSCTYTYKRSSAGQPGGKYQITATITWHVTWTCEGADCTAPGGDLGDHSEPSGQTPLVVSEIQTNTGQ